MAATNAAPAADATRQVRVSICCFPPVTPPVLLPRRCVPRRASTMLASLHDALSACVTHARSGARGPKYLGFNCIPEDPAARFPYDALLFALGSHMEVPSAAALAAMTPRAATLCAGLLLANSLATRVKAAFVLQRHASNERTAAARTQPHVLDALCAAVGAGAAGGFRDGGTASLHVESVCRAVEALRKATDETKVNDSPPEAYAALLAEQGVTEQLLSSHDAVCAAKVTVANLCLNTLTGLLAQPVEASDEVAHAARTRELVVQLHARGAVEAAAALAAPAAWVPGGSAALAPPAVAARYGDDALTSAANFLVALQQRVLAGAPGEERTTRILLPLALEVGGAAATGSLQRGLAAFLLSFAAPFREHKAAAIAAGAMRWSVEVAAAADTYAPATRARALAGAGNIAAEATDAASLEPLQVLSRDVLTAHAPTIGTLRVEDHDTIMLVYNAAFIVMQLASLREVRPWYDEHAEVRAALLQLLAAAHRAPLLVGFVGLIQGAVLPALSAPATRALRSHVDVLARAVAIPSRASPFGGGELPRRDTSALLRHVCAGCGAQDDGVTFKACARCMATRYCSPACQKAHWKAHKQTCVPKGTREP